MRSVVLVFFVWLCVFRGDGGYVVVMGCPPGVPCWPWHVNSQVGQTAQHMPQHLPLGHPMDMHHSALSDPYAQHSLPVSQQQWTWQIPQQATHGAYPEVPQNLPSHGNFQGAVGFQPHKNFNPKPPGRESPFQHHHNVNSKPIQVFPRRTLKPEQKPTYPTAQPMVGGRTTPSAINQTPPVNKYLCDIWKKDRKPEINSTPSPAPPQNPPPTHSQSATSARPPPKQPRPPNGQRPPTPPTNQVASGTSPSVVACQRYRTNALGFLDNQVRINGGEVAGKGEFPYMVALGYANGEKLKWVCGGSLISERFILTAAHCFQCSECSSNPREAMVLRMGLKQLDAGASAPRRLASDFGAEALWPHAAFNLRQVYHDVALVRTDRPVAFSADVRPVCLAPPTLAPAPGARWTTAGWGGDGALGESAFKGELKKAEMIELAETDCQIEGRSRVPDGLGSRILCTQHRRNNACAGDSGGPLVQQDENGQDILVGVFSSSGNPCTGNRTALFVRITSELQWIEGIVWPNVSK